MISTTHLHTMVVNFPMALLTAGFLSEVIALRSKKEFFRNAAFYLIMLVAIGGIVASLSGIYAGATINYGPFRIPIEFPEHAATITIWLAIIPVLFRIVTFYFKYNTTWTKWAGFILFVTVVGAVAKTGYLGGQSGYNQKVTVELANPDFNASAELSMDKY